MHSADKGKCPCKTFGLMVAQRRGTDSASSFCLTKQWQTKDFMIDFLRRQQDLSNAEHPKHMSLQETLGIQETALAGFTRESLTRHSR